MINPALLGRYECTVGGSNKFWLIRYNEASRAYETSHGAIGNKPVYLPRLLAEKEALRKINEKLKKDYTKVFINQIEATHQKLYLEETLEEIPESKERKKFKI